MRAGGEGGRSGGGRQGGGRPGGGKSGGGNRPGDGNPGGGIQSANPIKIWMSTQLAKPSSE